MSDDDLDDDVDAVDDEDMDDLPEADEATVNSGKARKKAATSSQDELEGVSLEAKERERQLLAQQIEEYLARGGKVQEVHDDVVNDPPRKPETKYGSRPI